MSQYPPVYVQQVFPQGIPGTSVLVVPSTPVYVAPPTYYPGVSHVKYGQPGVVLSRPGPSVNVPAVAPVQTIIVQQPSTSVQIAQSIGSAVGSVVRSAGELAGQAAEGFIMEVDRFAKSPLLDCFLVGSGVQLKSKASRGMLRVRPDGSFDCRGELGNDFAAHFLVTARFENSVTLKCGSDPTLNLTVENGQLCTRNVPSYFRLHETHDHCVTLQHDLSHFFVGFDRDGNLLPAAMVKPLSEESKFEVHLAYSPYGHVYYPNY